jgi:uncharacterized lipoprotein NlpE involved in copper resistance
MMTALITPSKQKLTLLLLGILSTAFNPALAKSDMEIMGEVQRAREAARHGKNHSQMKAPEKESEKFRGIYYGYLPCKDCDGIKTTLSLKNKNNYLLVTQYAKTSTREFFEKGKYDWNEKTSIVTLTARKDSSVRQYYIKDEGTLLLLTDEGKFMKPKPDKYALERSDTRKNRVVHIH